jgi:hypothetical protein
MTDRHITVVCTKKIKTAKHWQKSGSWWNTWHKGTWWRLRWTTILFNSSLQSEIVPVDWKHANVTPIFKKGDREL